MLYYLDIICEKFPNLAISKKKPLGSKYLLNGFYDYLGVKVLIEMAGE